MLTAETPFQQVIDIYSAITCVSVLFLVSICILLYSYMTGFARFRLLKRFGGDKNGKTVHQSIEPG